MFKCVVCFCQDFNPRIHLSDEDFRVITRTGCGTLLDSDGLLRFNQFEEVMRDQMKRFVQRKLTNTLAIQRFTGSEEVQLTTMKAILQEQVPSTPLKIICSPPIRLCCSNTILSDLC